MSLSDAEYRTVLQGAGGNVKAAAVSRLYSARDGFWRYTHKWGGLALVGDRGTNFLRLIDLTHGRPLWEHELYSDALYDSPANFFHTFEAADGVVGFSFAEEWDASNLLRAVWDVSRALPPPPVQPPSGAPPRPAAPPRGPPTAGVVPPTVNRSVPPVTLTTPVYPAPPPLAPRPAPSPPTTPGSAIQSAAVATESQAVTSGSFVKSTTAVAAGQKASKSKDEKKKKGWFSKFTESIMGAEEDVGGGLQLSGPTNFRHEAHIGWDPTNGFEIRNIPPEWRKLFQAAGVKKSELRDGQTAKFIMDTVAEATMGMNPTAGAPPPLPHRSGPPPLPPGVGYNTTMAPCPPPVPSIPSGPPPPPGPPAPGPPPPPVPGMPATSTGGGLLDGLLTAKLRSNNGPPGEGGLPDLKNLNEEQGNSLANTLAAAMAARRDAIKEDYDDDDELDSDDEWSN